MDNYVCVDCGKTYKSAKTLAVHSKTHSQDRPHVCPVCSKSFVRKDVYSQHMRAHDHQHPKYMCQECGKCFTRRNCLQAHHLHHMPEKKHACKICQKTYFTKINLKRHEATHEEKKNCLKCNKWLIHFKEHQKVCGQQQAAFRCDICGRSFKQKRYLAQHTRCVHTFEENYECQKCEKKYNHRASLFYHQKNCS